MQKASFKRKAADIDKLKGRTYKEEKVITEKIMEQILTIRQEGKYNMFDILGVQGEAFEKEFNELVVFLWEFKKEYVQFIMIGQR